MFTRCYKTGLFLLVSLCSSALFAEPPVNVQLKPNAAGVKIKLNTCANPAIRTKALTAVNQVDCEASVDPTFGVYFQIVNVYKDGRTITPRASCRALQRGEHVKLVLKQHTPSKDAYDIYVCP